MKNTELKFDFGIEELAVAISLVEKPQEAGGLLAGAFGKMAPEEERGRLLAAYNSLFARGLLTYEQKRATLLPEIKELLRIFFESHELIKVGKTSPSGEDAVSYYAHRDAWLEHSVTQGVAHRFCYPVKSRDIPDKIKTFLSPICLKSTTPVSVNLPSASILNAPPGTLSDYDALLKKLSATGSKTPKAIKLLAEDIANGLWRGSTVWISRPNEERLLSRGFLWVQGKDRLWAINSAEPDLLQALLCTQEEFDSRLRKLISSEAK